MSGNVESKSFQSEFSRTYLPADLLHFCSQQGVLPPLSVALALIEQCFPSLRELHLQPEHDPETGEEWLGLEITLQDQEDQVLAAYDQYTSQWVATVPWPERQKVRLSYNIL
jgi:hypothetical protein